MELSLHQPKNVLLIKSYTDGVLAIGEKKYTGEALITPHEVEHPFSTPEIDLWNEDTLLSLNYKELDILVIGTGYKMQLLPMPLQVLLSRAGTGYESMITESACRTFNILVSEGRKVSALLKL